jgi:GntR family histidine utilization transcriptional repressor
MLEQEVPRYQQVKNYITERIDSGEWDIDQRVPSENELVQALGISRMTVNRALRELTEEGLLRRVQGLGTFVADPRPQVELLELRNIADEIRTRGHSHSARVITLESLTADADEARALRVAEGTTVFRSVIVHMENDLPIQLENRLVNPATAPDYLSVDFTGTTPNEYLTLVAPATDVEHLVEAIIPNAQACDLLQMPRDEPGLLLNRRTWAGDKVVSRAWLTHPASRFRLGARFAMQPPVRTDRKN